MQMRKATDRTVVPGHGAAAPERSKDYDRILNLFTSYRWKAHTSKKTVESATKAKREATACQAMHGRRKRGCHQWMAGVVVGRGRGNTNTLGHGGGGTTERWCILHVESLRDEGCAEP